MKYKKDSLKTSKKTKAKYGLKATKKLPMYAEDGDIIPGGMQVSTNPTGAPNGGYWQNPHGTQQMPQEQPNIFPQGPYSTNSDAPQPITNTGTNNITPQPEQHNKAGKFLRNQIDGTSISSNNVFAGELQAINGLLPYQKPKDNKQLLVKAYNPYPNGTNSHASFQDGGSVRGTQLSKSQEGKYQSWRKTLPKNLQYEGDYDLRGFYKENPKFKANDPKQHMTDKFKLPNHPTFSNESMYFNESNKDSAGHWEDNTYLPYNPSVKDTVVEKGKNGKKVEPAYVNSPNNPRYRAYQDSLELYNRGENKNKAFKTFIKEHNIPESSVWTDNKKAYDPSTNIQPRLIQGLYSNYDGHTGTTSITGTNIPETEIPKDLRIKNFRYTKPSQSVIVGQSRNNQNIQQLPTSQSNQFPTQIQDQQPQQVDPYTDANYSYQGNGTFVPDDYHRKLGYPNKTGMRNGGKMKGKKIADDGVEITPDIRTNWNKFQAYASQQPGYGEDMFNHNSQLGQNLLSGYNQSNPNNAINPNLVQPIQQDFINQQKNNPSFVKSGNQGFSGADNYLGSKTQQQSYKNYEVEHIGSKGQVLSNKKFGANPDAANKELQGMSDDFSGYGNSTPTTSNQSFTPNVESQQRDKMFPTREQAIANRKTQKSNWHTNENSSYMQNGGQIEQGQNGLYVDGGKASKIGDNGFTGDTIQFDGPSHADGGIDINYGGTPVEVEGGETAFIDRTGDMNVFGNLHVPGTNTKFKDMGKKIAKEEGKNNKMANKSSELIMNADPHNKFENSKFNSGAVLQDAYEQRQKDLASTKEYLANVQNHMLAIADKTGTDPKKVSSMYKAKFGKKIADSDSKVSGDDDDIRLEQIHMTDNTPDLVKEALKKYGHTNQYKDYKKYNMLDSSNPYDDFVDGLDGPRTQFVRNYIAKKQQGNRFGPSSEFDPSDNPNIINQRNSESVEPLGLKPMETNPVGPRLEDGNFNSPWQPKTTSLPEMPEFRVPKDNGANKNVAQKPRPKFLRDKLGLTDVIPELTEMFDRAEPVQRQEFNPQLLSPYQVSFNDVIAENQGDFNAIQKTLSHNPAALGALSAQKYNNDSKVKGEEFRTNQGISNDITNKNMQILNQAQTTNLQLADEQYGRQAQAEENARSNRFSAMESLSSKYAQNRRDNTTLRIYEDMYNYGYDPKNGYTHLGPDFQLGPSNVGIQQSDTKTKQRRYPSDPEKDYTESDSKQMGGSVSGFSGKMAGRFNGGASNYNKKKKKPK